MPSLLPPGSKTNRCPTPRQVERLKRELHVVMSEMLYRLVEVVHFQHKHGGPFGRRLQEWFVSDGERVRIDLILDPRTRRRHW